MFRTANERRNYILEANLKVYFLRDEVTAEGHALRRFYELKLLRDNTPKFLPQLDSYACHHPR